MNTRLYNIESVLMTFFKLKDFESSMYSSDVREFARLMRSIAMVDYPSTTIFDVNYFDADLRDTMHGDIEIMGGGVGGKEVMRFEDLFNLVQHNIREGDKFMVVRWWRDSILTVLNFVID